jgi:hypothetical protein
MGIVEDIRLRGATFRITEESLYAEALREMEAGLRRDGLWAKALVESSTSQTDARTCYLKLRVQSLRDEIDLVQEQTKQERRKQQAQAMRIEAEQKAIERAAYVQYRNRPRQGLRDWLEVLVGLIFVVLVGILVVSILQRFHLTP